MVMPMDTPQMEIQAKLHPKDLPLRRRKSASFQMVSSVMKMRYSQKSVFFKSYGFVMNVNFKLFLDQSDLITRGYQWLTFIKSYISMLDM